MAGLLSPASGELREAWRALLPDSAGPTLIDTSTRSEHDGDRGNRFAVLSGLSGEPEQIVEPRAEINGSDTESDRPHTQRRRRLRVVWMRTHHRRQVTELRPTATMQDSDGFVSVQRERLLERHQAVHVATESITLLATRVDPTVTNGLH